MKNLLEEMKSYQELSIENLKDVLIDTIQKKMKSEMNKGKMDNFVITIYGEFLNDLVVEKAVESFKNEGFFIKVKKRTEETDGILYYKFYISLVEPLEKPKPNFFKSLFGFLNYYLGGKDNI